MSEINDVVGIEEVEWDGRAWKIPRPNYLSIAAYERWLRLGAVRDADSLRGDVSEFAYNAAIDAITRCWAAREYDWWGKLWLRSLDSPACCRHLAWLMVTQEKDQQTLTRQRMERFYDERKPQIDAALARLVLTRTPPTPPPQPQEAGAA